MKSTMRVDLTTLVGMTVSRAICLNAVMAFGALNGSVCGPLSWELQQESNKSAMRVNLERME